MNTLDIKHKADGVPCQEFKKKTDEEPKHFIILKEAAKCLLTAGIVIPLSNRWIFRAGQKIKHATGICPSSLFPQGTTEFFDKYFHYPRYMISDLKNPSCFVLKTLGPVVEELVDRVLVQECLLKRVPTKILQKFSPNHAHLTNHIIARVARVLTSSLYFALHHSWAHNCRGGDTNIYRDSDMYPYIMAGVALGTLQEISGHPIYNLVAHVAANTLIFPCKLW